MRGQPRKEQAGRHDFEIDRIAHHDVTKKSLSDMVDHHQDDDKTVHNVDRRDTNSMSGLCVRGNIWGVRAA